MDQTDATTATNAQETDTAIPMDGALEPVNAQLLLEKPAESTKDTTSLAQTDASHPKNAQEIDSALLEDGVLESVTADYDH